MPGSGAAGRVAPEDDPSPTAQERPARRGRAAARPGPGRRPPGPGPLPEGPRLFPVRP